MTAGDLDKLNDDELAERARKVHATLVRLPRNHVNRDSYILAWRRVIDEMNRRSLPPYETQDDLTMRKPGTSGFVPGGFYPSDKPPVA